MEDNNDIIIYIGIVIACLIGYFLIGSWIWIVLALIVIIGYYATQTTGYIPSISLKKVDKESVDSFFKLPTNLNSINIENTENTERDIKFKNLSEGPIRGPEVEPEPTDEVEESPEETKDGVEEEESADAAGPDADHEVRNVEPLYVRPNKPSELNSRAFLPTPGTRSPPPEVTNKWLAVNSVGMRGNKKSTLNDYIIKK